ncbi:MAG: hypothetical protein IPL61_39600 [Myxococcales bacterium]|nr:hypothetical protein [Myxococcales bacterium]
MTRATIVAVVVLGAPAVARAQFVDRTVVVEDAAPPPEPAAPTGPETAATSGPPPKLEVRLTLSSFLYRELGDDAAPLVANGAAPATASPVRRFFGDLRGELTAERVAGGTVRVDARARAATLERYQAGDDEYEVRTLSYARPVGPAELRIGRQVVEALGATKIDGASVAAPLTGRVRATAFAGAYPQRGSRSLTTDYPELKTGGRLVPVAGGVGVGYRRASIYGDVGLVGVVASADVPGAATEDGRRGFLTTSGYARPRAAIDVYWHGIVDVVAAGGARLTEASAGLDLWPHPAVDVALTGHHVEPEVFALAAANDLADPDPAAVGQIENGTAIVRVAQDAARASVSVAAAATRFQLTAAAGWHRRPEVAVPLTGGGALTIPAAQMGELTMSALDRRSLGGARVEVSGTALVPVGDASATRSRALVARLIVARARPSHEVVVDLSAHRHADLGDAGGCVLLDPRTCYGTSTSRGLTGGAVVTVTASRDWLVLVDAHGGLLDTDAMFAAAPVTWPRLWWVSAFARLQWRYR